MRTTLYFYSILAVFSLACSTLPVNTYRTIGRVDRLDPALNAMISEEAEIEILADGFGWSEGPVWIKDKNYLLFNDIPANTLYKWSEEEGLNVFLRPAGYAMVSADSLIEFGCNGLFVNPLNRRLVLCEHGNRCLSELDEKRWVKRVIADRYQGKKFNSPNDLVISKNGDIYFTDPPYGLKSVNGSQENNPLKELSFCGIFHYSPQGDVTLISDELDRPNGIALSPDEKTLYVANSGEKAIWMAFDVTEDGNVNNGRLFFDAGTLRESGKKGNEAAAAIDFPRNNPARFRFFYPRHS